MMFVKVPAILSLLLFVVSDVKGVDKSESDLRQALFERYDKLVRPVQRTTDTIQVRVDLTPTGIRDVDVKDREVKFDSWLLMRWEDQYLTWDSNVYGVNQLSLPSDLVWKPDVTLYSAISDSGVLPSVLTNVVVFNNGTVLWVPPFTVKNRCPPTENQITETTFQCTLVLGSWTYHNGLLDVQEYSTNPLERVSNDAFHNVHPKWILESITASSVAKKYPCCEDLYSEVKYDMRFRKRGDTED